MSVTPSRVFLLRHGETEWSITRQHTGRTDIPLTVHGEQQARALAPLLARRRTALVLVSPLGRARRTAELAGLTGARPEPGLREWDYGTYEGITTDEIHRTRPAWNLWNDGVPVTADGLGESAEQVGCRVQHILDHADRILRGSCSRDPGDVVLVAHAHVLRILTARRLGLPPCRGALFQLATASISSLGTEHGRPVLTSWNTVP